MSKTKFKNYLKQKNMNFTHERQILLAVILDEFTQRKFTAKDIEIALVNSHEYINNSTIYRSLKIFLAAEVIENISDDEGGIIKNNKTAYYQIVKDDSAKINYQIVIDDIPIITEIKNSILNKSIKKICVNNNICLDNIKVSITGTTNKRI